MMLELNSLFQQGDEFQRKAGVLFFLLFYFLFIYFFNENIIYNSSSYQHLGNSSLISFYIGIGINMYKLFECR